MRKETRLARSYIITLQSILPNPIDSENECAEKNVDYVALIGTEYQ